MEAAAGAGDRGAVPENELEDVVSTAERYRYEIDELLAIARALSSERDAQKLLGLILEKSRQITGADAGSVYIVEDPARASDTAARRSRAPREGADAAGGAKRADGTEPGERVLHFMLAQNDSMAVDFKEFRLPVNDKSIVGRAVLQARPINIADVTRLSMPGQNPGGLQHNRLIDDRTGYRARSMLTVPMLSARNEVMGVIQLINRKRDPILKLQRPEDFDAGVIPFDARAVELALALAAQAGISLENATLYEEIRRLFEGFVDASVTAIESRDPTTSGHSRRVATLSVGLAEKVDALAEGPLRDVRFSREDLRQIEYAGVLHDFGKVGVRENVLTKAKKLYDSERRMIELRFKYIRRTLEAEAAEMKLAMAIRKSVGEADLLAVDRELAARVAELDEMLRLVRAANEPTVLSAPAVARIAEIAQQEYVDLDGTRRPYLESDEVTALSITRGSLTELERREIQSHVTHTMSFLSTIPWGRSFRNIPQIAGAHHETLDGRGYPYGLRGDEISLESRMLTISDIFDALTAADRPYKAAVPVPKALAILEEEVRIGRCDPDLFRVFIEAEVYRAVIPA